MLAAVTMRINLASVVVSDQAAALRLYTAVLGFVKKTDIPLGPGVSWLTGVAPDPPDARGPRALPRRPRARPDPGARVGLPGERAAAAQPVRIIRSGRASAAFVR